MIETISVRKTASFDETGISITGLKKVNFIYGANGSGKTTISNQLAEPTEPEFRDCKIEWQHNQPLQNLVYNKKFRDKNFGNGTIEGVFTLGQATTAEIEVIEDKQIDLSGIKEAGIKKKETLEVQVKKRAEEEERFKNSAWENVYKKHEGKFKEAFKGYMQKELFKNNLLYNFSNNHSDLESLEKLIERAKTIFGEKPENVAVHNEIDFERLAEIESNDIWEQKIIGKLDVDIAALIQKLSINDWVNEGKEYLQANEICPFCQQPTITADFRKKLDDYFDASFTESIKKVQALASEYEQHAENLVNQLAHLESSERTNKDSRFDVDLLAAFIKTVDGQFAANKERLKAKIKEPSRSVALVLTKKQLTTISEEILSANTKIEKHNKIVSSYELEHGVLVRAIWRLLIEDYQVEIESYRKAIDGLDKGIVSLSDQYCEMRKEYKALSKEIKLLTNNVTSIVPTVDRINATLQRFGFLNFEIVPSKEVSNHYQLQRQNGELASTSLSEGEITFITFLYFMQLARGATNRDEISNERVLIVDDPISSLDSTILFVVSTILKGVISDIKNGVGNVKQIVVLTHNVYFHKEVSFINGREDINKNTNFWILRKGDGTSSIQSFGMHNPIQTSYELLWSELKDVQHNSGVATQNTMRRIIEHYFKMLGKYGDDDLIQKFEIREEQEICRSLICWINDGSHSITDDLFIELQEDSIDKYLKVFEDIFVLTDHKGHYNMMMGIDGETIENAA